MNDGECIKATLKEMGYVFEEHKEAQHLYGYMGDKRKQKANIIVRRRYVGAAANDVGFLRKSDGTYEMIISEYDRAGAKTQAKNFMKNIHQIYNKHLVLKQAKRNGLIFQQQKITKDNKIKIQCTYMGA